MNKQPALQRLFAPGGRPLPSIAAHAEEELDRTSQSISKHLHEELRALELSTEKLIGEEPISREELMALSEQVSSLLGLSGMVRDVALSEGLRSFSQLIECILDAHESRWPPHSLFCAALEAHALYCKTIQTHSEEADETARDVLDHLSRLNEKVFSAR